MSTLEAAFLVPLIICIICFLFSGTIYVFREACTELELVAKDSQINFRKPAEVIRNTDLVLSYLERLTQAWEDEK